MNRITRILLATATAAGLASSAFAQSEQEFIDAFSGEWYVFDPAQHDSADPCALTLQSDRVNDVLPVTTDGCAAPLELVDRWAIREGRIILSTPTAELAVMGGNQFRVTGELNETDTSLVIERAQGDGSSAQIAAALRKHKCYFVGFTQQCAVASDLKIPAVNAEEGFATIETLATINARAQPRRDAASVGNIAQGTRVRVNQCLTASDGPWCRARVGETSVWLAMTALRQDEWPVVTYRLAQPEE
ncbi:hypothetical protein ABMC89_11210 [Sulfitobacter sp. HNIBRBA3233]|uniref:SH3 domain-containing protein n=1 Tax=Sulfitobacter marinivivus TaxID=3158558 RepID=UPI0032DEDF1B